MKVEKVRGKESDGEIYSVLSQKRKYNDLGNRVRRWGVTPKQTQSISNTEKKNSNNKSYIGKTYYDHCHQKVLDFNIMMIGGILYESDVAVNIFK